LTQWIREGRNEEPHDLRDAIYHGAVPKRVSPEGDDSERKLSLGLLPIFVETTARVRM
jgi:hypothetical protein